MMSKNPSIDISIIVPVYNEDIVLPKFFSELHKELLKLSRSFEVIFVNDGSSDNTYKLLLSLHQQYSFIKVLSLSRNHGHQLAITAGMDFSSGQYTLTMDADLQHPPHLIHKFITKCEEGYDIVSGVKQRTIKRGLIKSILAISFYKIFQKISNISVDPHVSDFRIFSRKALDVIKGFRERDRYIRGIAVWSGFRQTTIPYTAPPRKAGAPKYTIKKLGQLAGYGIFSFSSFPMRISLYTGLIIITGNTVFLIGTIVHRLIDPTMIQGYTTILSVILFLFSFLFIFLGIIGEYIFKIFQEVKQRPLYILDSHHGFHKPSPSVQKQQY